MVRPPGGAPPPNSHHIALCTAGHHNAHKPMRTQLLMVPCTPTSLAGTQQPITSWLMRMTVLGSLIFAAVTPWVGRGKGRARDDDMRGLARAMDRLSYQRVRTLSVASRCSSGITIEIFR